MGGIDRADDGLGVRPPAKGERSDTNRPHHGGRPNLTLLTVMVVVIFACVMMYLGGEVLKSAPPASAITTGLVLCLALILVNRLSGRC